MKEPCAARTFADGRGYARIQALVPDAEEKVWFIPEDHRSSHLPVYGTTPTVAQQIIGESYGFEYYLVAKDLGRLLCENHHGAVIAAGSIHRELERVVDGPVAGVSAPERGAAGDVRPGIAPE